MEQEHPLSVTIRRTRQDYFAFSRQVSKGLANVRIYYCIALAVLVIVYLNGMDLVLRKRLLPEALTNSKYALYAFCIALVVGVQLLLRRCFLPMMRREYMNDNQAFLREKKVSIDEKGFREVSDVSDSYIAWEGVAKIEKTKDFILVYVDRLSAYCIPMRHFATPSLAESFYDHMLSYWHTANGRTAGVRAS